jgi:hypothetical protein
MVVGLFQQAELALLAISTRRSGLMDLILAVSPLMPPFRKEASFAWFGVVSLDTSFTKRNASTLRSTASSCLIDVSNAHMDARCARPVVAVPAQRVDKSHCQSLYTTHLENGKRLHGYTDVAF